MKDRHQQFAFKKSAHELRPFRPYASRRRRRRLLSPTHVLRVPFFGFEARVRRNPTRRLPLSTTVFTFFFPYALLFFRCETLRNYRTEGTRAQFVRLSFCIVTQHVGGSAGSFTYGANRRRRRSGYKNSSDDGENVVKTPPTREKLPNPSSPACFVCRTISPQQDRNGRRFARVPKLSSDHDYCGTAIVMAVVG